MLNALRRACRSLQAELPMTNSRRESACQGKDRNAHCRGKNRAQKQNFYQRSPVNHSPFSPSRLTIKVAQEAFAGLSLTVKHVQVTFFNAKSAEAFTHFFQLVGTRS